MVSAVSGIVLSILVAFVAIKFLWSRRWLYYHAWKADGPFAWPIFGNGLYFVGRSEGMIDMILSALDTYKPPVRVWLGPKLIFGISLPKHLEVVLNGPLAKEEMIYKFVRPIFGNGLISSPVEKWKVHRKVIQPTFNQKILNGFVGIFAKHAKLLVERLQDKAGRGIFDPYFLLDRCSLETVCESALGSKTIEKNSENFDFVECIERMTRIFNMRIVNPLYHIDFFWGLTQLSKELEELTRQKDQFIKNIVVEKKMDYRNLKSKGLLPTANEILELEDDLEDKSKPFLECLVELSEDGGHWTDEEIIAEAITITVAGSETSAITNSFALTMLGIHPEIQDRVHEELDEVFGSSKRDPTPGDLRKLEYLKLVIKETLRLFPPGPVIVRAVEEDIELDETHVLPKDSSAAVMMLHTHRNPEFWPDPLKFIPERFLPEECAKRHPYAYVPFSAGPRNCVGYKYAMMAMKVVLSTVLRRYRVSTDFKTVEDVRLADSLPLHCAGGYRVAFENRSTTRTKLNAAVRSI